MVELLAGNHHGAGWMTTGFAVFLWCLLPFTGSLFVYRLVRDVRALGTARGAVRADLRDRIFGWCTHLMVHVGSLFLATHRIWTTW